LIIDSFKNPATAGFFYGFVGKEAHLERMRMRLLLWVIASLLLLRGFCLAESGQWESLANPYVFGQEIQKAIEERGWNPVREELANEAYEAYTFNRASAERLLYAFLWVDLLRKNEKAWMDAWYAKRSESDNGDTTWEWECRGNTLLADRLDPDVFLYLMSHPELAQRVMLQLNEKDFVPRFLEVLSELYRGNKYAFERFPQLAFAIALVHDFPPPYYWPHQQVSEEALPRKLRDPLWVLNFLVDRQRTPRQLKLEDISLFQALFLVDICLSDEDVAWVSGKLKLDWQNLEKQYMSVPYQSKRIGRSPQVWPYSDYSLSTIRQCGGICVDQAYYAYQVTKAFGIPSLLFSGNGSEGRHAWFGYLDIRHQWNLNAGRYASQRFVTGNAVNPQTWDFINDHELEEIMTGRYEKHQSSRAQLHHTWARSFMNMGLYEEADKALGAAIQMDRQNIVLWKTKIAFKKARGATVSQLKSVYRSALYALNRKPDLENQMSEAYIEFLESEGQSMAAEVESRRIQEKYKTYRSDILLKKSGEIMRDSLAEDAVSGQWLVYQKLIAQLEGQGIGVMDHVVSPFVKHQRKNQQLQLAKKAIDLAWERLNPKPKSQFARELKKLQNGTR